jgi:hypothetical protein
MKKRTLCPDFYYNLIITIAKMTSSNIHDEKFNMLMNKVRLEANNEIKHQILMYLKGMEKR